MLKRNLDLMTLTSLKYLLVKAEYASCYQLWSI